MKFNFLLVAILSVIFIGCSSDSNNSVSNSDVIKYEITSTSPFQVIGSGTSTLPSITVAYTNETGQRQQEQLQISGTNWSKTVNLTTLQRPIAVAMEANGNTQTNSGNVTLKVYVNGSLRGTQIVNISQSSFQNYGMFVGGYIGGILID